MSSRTQTRFLALWIALLCIALALSVLAAANETLPGDRATTEWLQDQAFPGQNLSDLVRALTTTEVVLATGAVASLGLWLKGYRRQAILLGAGLVILAILQSGIKEIVDRPRPDAAVVEVRAGRSSPSFPAGHVMSGMYLYGFLIYVALTLPLARCVGFAIMAAAGLVVLVDGPVNVWLGVHWPSDVLGGYLLAIVILLPLFLIDYSRQRVRSF